MKSGIPQVPNKYKTGLEERICKLPYRISTGGEQSEDNFRTQNYETHMETIHHHEKRVTIHKTRGFVVPRYLGQQKYVVEIQIIKLKFTKDRRHKKT